MARSARSRKAPRNAGKSTPKPRRPWWRRWWLALLVLPAIVLAAFGLLAFYVVFSSVPLPDDLEAISSVVYDVDGEEVGGLASEVGREDVDLADLPEHVPQAVLAAEDRDFYEHRGISVTGIARALFTNVRSGSIQGGGSTITQQYLKYTALTPEQTYRRKVEEAALAIKMEQEFEKDEILSFYLNTAYWGRGNSGIGAASLTYFGIPASELDVNQAATLAGLLPAPEIYDPLENPERADGRRRYVLEGMLTEGYLTQAEHDALVADGLPEVSDLASLDRGANAYYIEAVRRELSARPEFAQGELFRGLRIHTELDQRLQSAAQDTVTNAVAEGPTDTGAIVTIDPATGGVRALVGGPDIVEQQFNTASRAVRQPGSTFKAFTLEAFIAGGYAPESRYPAPAELELDDAEEPIRNYGGSSFGEQTVRQATASSTNTVFVQMQEEVGRERVIDAAGRAGLPLEKDDEVIPTERTTGDTMRPFAGLTLGQDLFSPLEMTAAYATYAGEGMAHTPRLVARVEDRDGRVLYEPDAEGATTVDVEVARTVTDVLREVVTSGSGTAAALDDRPVAGKTGTTNDSRDTWFVGYVPQLTTSVWLGNLDNSPIEAENATGGGLAAPVWREYMTLAVEGLEPLDFTPPGDLDLEIVNEEPEACPEGYAFADPPSSADEDGFFPDVLEDIIDDQGRPCVEIKPQLEQCPAGYAFADPPTGPDEFGRTPDVIEDIVDFQGRPCVEQLEDPEPEDDGEDDNGDDDGDGDDGDDGGDDGDDGDGDGDGGDDGDGDDGDDGGDDGDGDGDDDGDDGEGDAGGVQADA
jgi:penicillin-binding protein 1A